MKKIERYILSKCLFHTMLILCAFVLLFSIISILGEMGDLGKGDYDFIAMVTYIAILIPNYIYLLMPLAILIGVMLAMLSLVNYSEFAVMRTSGVSLNKITAILLVFGTIFSLVTFMLGEVVAPQANHYAQVYKKVKTKQVISTQLHSGIWSKDGDHSFVNIKQILPNNTILGISAFHYDSGLQLHDYFEADVGRFDDAHHYWILDHVTTHKFVSDNLLTNNYQHYAWKTSIEPSYFSVLVIAPEDMSAFGLIKYMEHLRQNHQSVQRYEVAFWGKLLYPMACISMSLIALAFTPNNRRNINLGAKLFAGILIGLAFFFTTKLIGFMALLFHWNAVLSAVSPTLILFVVGWYFVLKRES